MDRLLNIFIFGFMILCCVKPVTVAAQTVTVTLKDCIRRGLDNNLQFQIEQLKVMRAEKGRRSKASRFLPQISGSISHNYYFGSTIDPASNARIESNIQSDNFGLDGSINLFNFAELWESTLQADDHIISLQSRSVIEREFQMNLIQTYYDALAAQEWKKVIEEQLRNSQEQVERISQEVAEGAKSESDMYDIRVVYTEEKKILQQTIQDEENQKLALLQLMNDNVLKPDDMVLVHEEIVLHQSRTNLSEHPKIRLEQTKRERLEHEYKQLLGPMLPKLTLSYSFGTFYSNKIKDVWDTSLKFDNQLSNNKNQFLGLNLIVPLFSRGDRMRVRKVKRIEMQEQQLILEKTRLDLDNRYEQEQQKIRQYEGLYPVLYEHLEASKKSLQTTRTKFEFGRVDISAYKAAKNQVLSASYDLLKNHLYKLMAIEMVNTMQ